ncbi:hypothetical protein GCM10025771_12140 [Niveibacterium umoris]|uniref:Phosphatidic acid phosphatase type 2/haloperoxidase domain-containing protein n=1 Tax=Niveibacterium umoris TaxID=1193620 RepID=A0A840BI53_9RHOO|nr:hypothetical protein [Niveibacterium umoris]MBB4013231.1 hypothetical protein [Niveibacterium umoris]
MPSYETLAAIANAYTPTIGLLWLACVLRAAFAQDWPVAAWRLALGLACVAICYAMMFADKALALWPAFGLDYSTHAAVSFAFVALLCTLLPRARWVWIGSLVAYAGLMMIQRYHSLADILSTAAVIGPPIVALCLRVGRRARVATPIVAA